jgi:hypothetical protein
MTLPAYTGVLTPAHRQIITSIREQWAAVVLSTAPVDRGAVVDAARRLYEANKLRQPSLTKGSARTAPASGSPFTYHATYIA